MKINKIYNENCIDTMAKMPDGFVDANEKVIKELRDVCNSNS
jgi:hypothetical protein